MRNAHRNLGHPSPQALVRLMHIAKVDKAMIAYAKEYKCSTCKRRVAPGRIPRTCMPYRPTIPFKMIAIDLKEVHDVDEVRL